MIRLHTMKYTLSFYNPDITSYIHFSFKTKNRNLWDSWTEKELVATDEQEIRIISSNSSHYFRQRKIYNLFKFLTKNSSFSSLPHIDFTPKKLNHEAVILC